MIGPIQGALAVASVGLLLAGCVTSGSSGSQTASGGSPVYASGETPPPPSESAKPAKLAHCAQPMGTVVVREPDAAALTALQGFGLQSPTPVLRMMMAESNCFRVIETPAYGNRAPSAKWVLTPNVIATNSDAGGFNPGTLLRFIPVVGGSVKTKDAQTALFLSDTKSGEQIAAVQGDGQGTDFTVTISGAGAYGNTSQGKVVLAAFADAYNKLVLQMQSRRRV